MKGYFKDSGLLYKLIQFIVVLMACLIVTISLVSATTNGDITNIHSLKIMQLIQSIGVFILPPMILAYLWSDNAFTYLQLNKSLQLKPLILVLLLMVAVIPFVNLIASVNQQIKLPDFMLPIEIWMKESELQAGLLTERLLQANSLQAMLFNVFLIAMIPALGEELFFRGVVQKIMSESRSVILAIWVAAIFFSAIHMQFYGFVPRMLLGAMFGYLLFWSGNLWLPIIAHFMNNAIAVLFYSLKFKGYKVLDIDTIGSGNSYWVGLVSAAISFYLIWAIYKSLKKMERE